MDRKRFAITAGIGCVLLVLMLIVAGPMLLLFPSMTGRAMVTEGEQVVERAPIAGAAATQQAIPTFTPPPSSASEPTPQTEAGERLPGLGSNSLTALYRQFNPGVVNIQVFVDREALGGLGAGSGFILNEDGYIVTNNHVVAEAQEVTVVFYNEFEAHAEVIGTDPDSDLAVIKVDELPEGAQPLSLADSDDVEVGDWVVAIGNPFGQQSSMSIGIVSAVGRMIPSGMTPFSIPQAIQTDAAINPGNSGGPLLNLRGEVIGVNAQIASANALANSGVGFAIPANVVRRVIPVLIETGSYQWPWLGVEGGSVNLALMEANDLETQQGAYISAVVPDGPADDAGLKGATDTVGMNGFDVVVGGDVVIEADGQPVVGFSDLLALIAFKTPGDTMELTVVRDGQRQQFTVELEARPDNFPPSPAASPR